MTTSINNFIDATYNRDLITVERYLREGGDPNAERIEVEAPPLVNTIAVGFNGGTDLLLSSPRIDVNKMGRDRLAPLHMAALTNNIEAIRKIIELGARVNIRDVDQLTPLHLAAKYNHVDAIQAMVETARKVGATLNLNALDNQEQTPLMIACQEGHQAAAAALIACGADTNKRCAIGYTAKSYCILYGFEPMAALFPYDPYTEEFIYRKVAAHFLGIDGQSAIGKTTFSLNGASSPHMIKKFAETLPTFFQQFPCDYSAQLIDAFRSPPLIWVHSPTEIVRQIKTRNLIVLPSGWRNHAIDILFYRSYMVICNRGDGICAGRSTLEAFQVNRDLFNAEIVGKIKDQSYENTARGSRFYYETLPALLSDTGAPVQDMWRPILNTIAPKPQKWGTCALASAKAALRAAWLFLAVDRALPGETYIEVAERVKVETKRWSLHARGQILQEYFNAPTADPQFKERCLNILASKVKKVRERL